METHLELRNIFSPVRIMKVQDWRKIAVAVLMKNTGGYINPDTYEDRINDLIIDLITRYELLTSRRLEKEMFVPNAEKPEPLNIETRKSFVTTDEMSEHRLYSNALKKVWFAGFEERNMFGVEKMIESFNLPLIVHFGNIGASFSLGEYWQTNQIKDATIFDFIIEINRYNRTSPSKIQINFTDSFINELIR